MKFSRLLTYLATFASLATVQAEAPSGTAWTRHVVDDTKVGADGVRFDDVNGDGLLDITTGWEQGGVVRAYINPGPLGVTNHWPVVEAGAIGDVEDAVFADLDGDGSKDIIASAEGSTRKINIFWAPSTTTQYLDSTKWTSGTLYGQLRWMFALAGQVDGINAPDIIIGGKDTDAEIALFRSPAGKRARPRRLAAQRARAYRLDHDARAAGRGSRQETSASSSPTAASAATASMSAA